MTFKHIASHCVHWAILDVKQKYICNFVTWSSEFTFLPRKTVQCNSRLYSTPTQYSLPHGSCSVSVAFIGHSNVLIKYNVLTFNLRTLKHFFSPCVAAAERGPWPLEVSRSHTSTTTGGRSARRRDLYLTTHTTLARRRHPCRRRDSNPRPQRASERLQTNALERAATEIGY